MCLSGAMQSPSNNSLQSHLVINLHPIHNGNGSNRRCINCLSSIWISDCNSCSDCSYREVALSSHSSLSTSFRTDELFLTECLQFTVFTEDIGNAYCQSLSSKPTKVRCKYRIMRADLRYIKIGTNSDPGTIEQWGSIMLQDTVELCIIERETMPNSANYNWDRIESNQSFFLLFFTNDPTRISNHTPHIQSKSTMIRTRTRTWFIVLILTLFLSFILNNQKSIDIYNNGTHSRKQHGFIYNAFFKCDSLCELLRSLWSSSKPAGNSQHTNSTNIPSPVVIWFRCK